MAPVQAAPGMYQDMWQEAGGEGAAATAARRTDAATGAMVSRESVLLQVEGALRDVLGSVPEANEPLMSGVLCCCSGDWL